jgi:DNA-binding NtrC family response regulator
MGRIATAVVVTVAIVPLAGSVRLDACGDKFMLIGRALKYQQAYRATHPAVIVLVDTPQIRQLKLAQLFTDAGHKVQLVPDVASLRRVMSGSHPDLVVVDGNDAGVAGQTLEGSTSMMVPVLFNATHATVVDAERRYGVVLQAPDKNRHPLSVIDEALKLRTKRAVKS